MRPYRANLGGAFGSGLSGRPRPATGLDPSAIIDALVGGGTGLVRMAYLRQQMKQDAQQYADQRAEAERQHVRQAALDAEAATDRDAKRAWDAEQQQFQRVKMQSEGYDPGGIVATAAPSPDAIGSTSIADAYRSHAPHGAPGVGMVPQMAAPQLGTLPSPQFDVVAPSYDPTRSASFRQAAEKLRQQREEKLADDATKHQRALELEGVRHKNRLSERQAAKREGAGGGTSTAATERDAASEEAKILSVANDLARDHRDPESLEITKGMPWDQALAEATRRVHSVHGAARGGAQGTAQSGGIDLRDPKAGALVQRAYDTIVTGQGTIEQAEAAGMSQTMLTELRRRLAARGRQ